jgi:hypothetical protein
VPAIDFGVSTLVLQRLVQLIGDGDDFVGNLAEASSWNAAQGDNVLRTHAVTLFGSGRVGEANVNWRPRGYYYQTKQDDSAPGRRCHPWCGARKHVLGAIARWT